MEKKQATINGLRLDLDDSRAEILLLKGQIKKMEDEAAKQKKLSQKRENVTNMLRATYMVLRGLVIEYVNPYYLTNLTESDDWPQGTKGTAALRRWMMHFAYRVEDHLNCFSTVFCERKLIWGGKSA